MNAPKPPTTASGNVDSATVDVLLGFHREDIVALPDELVVRIRAADALKRAEDALGREIARADPGAVRRVHLDALKAAAAAGRLPADAGAPAVDAQRERAALELRYAIVRDAAAESAHELQTSLVHAADELGDLLLDALTSTLREATEPAAVVCAAEPPFAWSDPAAAVRVAAKPVQAAFSRLVTLSRLHDRLRRAAVGLAALAPAWSGIGDPAEAFAARQRAQASTAPEWRRAGGFAGYGVEQPTGGYGRDASWRFLPVGHPVQRLIAAATDPELEPIAEPL